MLRNYSKLSIIYLFCILLAGCESFDDPVEVRLEPDFVVNEWTNEIQDRSHIVVTSLANRPIKIQAISINRGNCHSQLTQGSSQLLHYGSFLKVTLQNCKIQMVKEVEIIIEGKAIPIVFK